MAVEVVSLETNHLFYGNPIIEQHRLRHRCIIERQNWDVPSIRDIEYDQYDNPAATYLIWRDEEGVARGSSRLYPTDRPFMLQEHFSHMVDDSLPRGKSILEGSRFCIDKTLTPDQRRLIAQELILAYIEHGLFNNVTEYIGIMYPIYWNHLFISLGWNPTWLGAAHSTPDGKKSRAGSVSVSVEALMEARRITGIKDDVTLYPSQPITKKFQVA